MRGLFRGRFCTGCLPGAGPARPSVRLLPRYSRAGLRRLVPPHPYGARDRKVPSALGFWSLLREGCLPSVTFAATQVVVPLTATIGAVSLPVNSGCLLKNRPKYRQTVMTRNRPVPNPTTHPSSGRHFRRQTPEGGASAQAREGRRASSRGRKQTQRDTPRRRPLSDGD